MGGGVSFFLRNFANLISFLSPFLERIPIKFLPMQIESVVSVVARTGRQLQRYDSQGCRLVVGCIPYRYKKQSASESSIEDLEVLLISSQNGHSMLFPKGGWESDESMEEAASRESLEEAGVMGNIERNLGNWRYMSKRRRVHHESCMFPLLVKQQLEHWPEENFRTRRWVTVEEAKELCNVGWMREALDALICRQMQANVTSN